MNSALYLPARWTGTPPATVAVTPETAGRAETSLWVVELAAGESVDRRSGDDEILVVSLLGSMAVSCGEGGFVLAGRHSVCAGPTDFAYIGRDCDYCVASHSGAHVAFCGAH